MRDGNHVTEMEEIARGEEFIQAGVCTLPPFLPSSQGERSGLILMCRNWKWEWKRLHGVKKNIVCPICHFEYYLNHKA